MDLPERNKKDKRKFIRIPLLEEKATYTYKDQTKKSDITDITVEGFFIKTKEILPPNSELEVELQLPGDLGILSVKADIIRVNWTVNRKKHKEHTGMGIKFKDVPLNIHKILEAYVIYLRNKQIITVSKRIIEEFFGQKEPRK